MAVNVIHLNNVREKEGGFTLIEMMIAIFILAVSILALLNLTIYSMQVNLQNDIRNTAVRLTTQVAEMVAAAPLEATSSGRLTPYDYTNAALKDPLGINQNYFKQYPNPVQTLRGTTQTYDVSWTVVELSSALKQVSISVVYRFKGKSYTNNAVIYKQGGA